MFGGLSGLIVTTLEEKWQIIFIFQSCVKVKQADKQATARRPIH